MLDLHWNNALGWWLFVGDFFLTAYLHLIILRSGISPKISHVSLFDIFRQIFYQAEQALADIILEKFYYLCKNFLENYKILENIPLFPPKKIGNHFCAIKRFCKHLKFFCSPKFSHTFGEIWLNRQKTVTAKSLDFLSNFLNIEYHKRYLPG